MRSRLPRRSLRDTPCQGFLRRKRSLQKKKEKEGVIKPLIYCRRASKSPRGTRSRLTFVYSFTHADGRQWTLPFRLSGAQLSQWRTGGIHAAVHHPRSATENPLTRLPASCQRLYLTTRTLPGASAAVRSLVCNLINSPLWCTFLGLPSRCKRTLFLRPGKKFPPTRALMLY